jgi:hypothetical protein
MYEYVEEKAGEAAREWFKQQSQNPYAALYLYYCIGELRVFPDSKPGYTLADSRRLMPGNTRDQIQRQIVDIARKTPFLPDVITG